MEIFEKTFARFQLLLIKSNLICIANQIKFDLHCKSNDWFLCECNTGLKWVEKRCVQTTKNIFTMESKK